MKPFPTTYSESSAAVEADSLTEKGQIAQKKLAEAGYEVRLGLTETDAATIQQLALEPSIIEYCPNDCDSRFRDKKGTTNWLSKGRAVFLLVEKATGDLAGYAWAGESQSDHVPDGKVTVAVRLSERHQGKGLATPYLAVVLDATIHLYDADNLWLESWASNTGAVHIYQKLGFTLVASVPSTRPTATGSLTPDTRLYMTLT
ncbi:GNAT family N-acetyltransferase [Candidatus Saccharibacteria bacterium]|nr:MAG: GNAT family N-acetyltransferase [Candidatus Saccharibacteria bacterium]